MVMSAKVAEQLFFRHHVTPRGGNSKIAKDTFVDGALVV
jgi:hypothetical protein